MRIVITGGAGYVGTVLTQLLLEHGYAVCCYDSLESVSTDSILHFFRNPHYELVRGDICDRKTLGEVLLHADAIVHLAAVVGYPAAIAMPDMCQRVNIDGVRCLNEVRSTCQPLVFASTGSVYGAANEGVCIETMDPSPSSLYARSKRAGECILLNSKNVLIYRFATGFGLSPQLRLDLLINDFCYQAVRHGIIVLYEEEFRRSFIHVFDMARAILHGIRNFPAMRGRVYNVGTKENNISKLAVAQRIKRYTPLHIHIGRNGRDQDQRNHVVSYQAIHATGYETTITLDDGIREMIRAARHIRLYGSRARALM